MPFGLQTADTTLILFFLFFILAPLLLAWRLVNCDNQHQHVHLCQYHTEHLSWAKPVPSHTPANTHTSPAVPTLKPSYSQVTRLGIRARDSGKQHVVETCDRPRDLQVLWGLHDPRARDPVKKTGDLLRDWSATQSGDYRYVTCLLNHPMGITNGGVRINKVVQLRIIGA